MFSSYRYLLLTYGKSVLTLACLAVVLTALLIGSVMNRWDQPARTVVGVVERIGYDPGAEESGMSSQRIEVRIRSGELIPLAYPRGCRQYGVGETVRLLEQQRRFSATPGYDVQC